MFLPSCFTEMICARKLRSSCNGQPLSKNWRNLLTSRGIVTSWRRTTFRGVTYSTGSDGDREWMTGISSSLVIPYTCRGLANPIKNIHSNNPWLKQYSLCFYVLRLANNTWHYLQLQMRSLTNDSKRHTKWEGSTLFIIPRDIARSILVTEKYV